MKNTKIEWASDSVSTWWGCTEVHEGCDHCYAKALAKRWGFSVWGIDNVRRIIHSAFKNFADIQKKAKSENTIRRVFVGSMMDIFEKSMPTFDFKNKVISGTTGDLRDELFRRISANEYPNLIFLFLTKRPSNINKYIPEEWKVNPPSNVMFGASVVNQKTADTLVPQLLKVNGLRFLSVEPQLEQLSLMKWLPSGELHWIIQGGESGHGRRPFDTDWGRSLRDECKETGVAYFFKQVDKVIEIPEDLMIREFYNNKK